MLRAPTPTITSHLLPALLPLPQPSMSDLEKILNLLVIIQKEVNDLKIAVKAEVQTMKTGTSRGIDSLSEQFVGVVGDFDNFSKKMLGLFDKWAKQADSQVVDKVLAIQGPRISAMENLIHREINKVG